MRPFDLIIPKDLAAASQESKKGAVLKAAGIDLLDLMKERSFSPKAVANLPATAELTAIRANGDSIEIGALATLQEIADAAILKLPALHALVVAAGEAATPQIRSRATVGGNLLQTNRCWYYRNAAFSCEHKDGVGGCRARNGEHRYHAILGYDDCVRVHPSNLAPALIVLGAEVQLSNAATTRRIPVRDLYPKTPKAKTAETTLQPGDILTRVIVPKQPTGTRTAYRESREKLSFDWATTAAAVRLVMDGTKIKDARICLGAVAPVPHVADRVDAALRGQPASEELFEKAAKIAFQRARPLAQNGYKVVVGQAVVRDALRAAAGGQG